MIIKTSTTGRTRPSAVATPLRAASPRAAAAVVAPLGGVRGEAATAMPFGLSLRPHVDAVVIDGGLANASTTSPENDAQLRASVRWSDDL